MGPASKVILVVLGTSLLGAVLFALVAYFAGSHEPDYWGVMGLVVGEIISPFTAFIFCRRAAQL